MKYLEQRIAALEKTVSGLEQRLAALEEPAILKQCRVDRFRDGPHGGGSVRLLHLPTGISAEGHAVAGDLRDLTRELAVDLEREIAAQARRDAGSLKASES